ncbi:MAG: Rpn family recombination-promoting nuclease/putative transposase [Oscillospiraceae bacterium]|jgi:predicted transposase/invertase (TIGR01784 family)|nr:Rpn family recombination-promoting nuclease/putative transposase [Oscillospiraceae bacterium]
MIDEIFIPPTSDLLFKWIFGDERDNSALTAFLIAVLDIPKEAYAEIEILNPFFNPEYDDDKIGILDIKVKTKQGEIIDIEIQVAKTANMTERVIFYIAKMITEQINSGDDYQKIKRVISIIITDHKLNDNTSYHHKYTLYDKQNAAEFTNLIEVHTLELPKLPVINDGTELFEWLQFLKIKGKAELEMTTIVANNPAVKNAILKVREFNADERERYLADQRLRGIRDVRARTFWEVTKNALNMSLTVPQIEQLTGLSAKEIEKIRADSNED